MKHTTHTAVARFRKATLALVKGFDPAAEWLEDAACADAEVSDFYPPEGDSSRPAGWRLCMECPVIADCLGTTLAREKAANASHGLAGGILASQRRELLVNVDEEDWPATIAELWAQALRTVDDAEELPSVARVRAANAPQFDPEASRPVCSEHPGASVKVRAHYQRAGGARRTRWSCSSGHSFGTEPDENGGHRVVNSSGSRGRPREPRS